MDNKKLHRFDLSTLPNMGQPHYAYYCNKECEFFPCHKLPENGFFNCLFCYCPLYALGDKCGGGFTYNERGIKDCSKCTLPHSEAGYAHVTGKFFEISAIATKNRELSKEDPEEHPSAKECSVCKMKE